MMYSDALERVRKEFNNRPTDKIFDDDVIIAHLIHWMESMEEKLRKLKYSDVEEGGE